MEFPFVGKNLGMLLDNHLRLWSVGKGKHLAPRQGDLSLFLLKYEQSALWT